MSNRRQRKRARSEIKQTKFKYFKGQTVLACFKQNSLQSITEETPKFRTKIVERYASSRSPCYVVESPKGDLEHVREYQLAPFIRKKIFKIPDEVQVYSDIVLI